MLINVTRVFLGEISWKNLLIKHPITSSSTSSICLKSSNILNKLVPNSQKSHRPHIMCKTNVHKSLKDIYRINYQSMALLSCFKEHNDEEKTISFCLIFLFSLVVLPFERIETVIFSFEKDFLLSSGKNKTIPQAVKEKWHNEERKDFLFLLSFGQYDKVISDYVIMNEIFSLSEFFGCCVGF